MIITIIVIIIIIVINNNNNNDNNNNDNNDNDNNNNENNNDNNNNDDNNNNNNDNYNNDNKVSTVSTDSIGTLSPVFDYSETSCEVSNGNATPSKLSIFPSTSKIIEILDYPVTFETLGPRSLCMYDLHIITGRGRHVNSSGTRGVLMKEIKEYLHDNYDLKVEKIVGNDGCIIVTKSSINKWLIKMATL